MIKLTFIYIFVLCKQIIFNFMCGLNNCVRTCLNVYQLNVYSQKEAGNLIAICIIRFSNHDSYVGTEDIALQENINIGNLLI